MSRASYGQLLSLESPPAWSQRSTLVLVPVDAQPGAPSISVARWPRPAKLSLRDAVAAHVSAMAESTPRLAVVSERPAFVGGREAREVRMSGLTGERGEPVENVHVYVAAPEGDLVVVVCSWEAPLEAAATEMLHRVLTSARFVRGGYSP